ncbi:hypothetical protein M0802_000397 [Mischocyttarus mexicanus]|nr:hypothetical protein M0802_000397 [Mischocyttarus mexicanus]
MKKKKEEEEDGEEEVEEERKRAWKAVEASGQPVHNFVTLQKIGLREDDDGCPSVRDYCPMEGTRFQQCLSTSTSSSNSSSSISNRHHWLVG